MAKKKVQIDIDLKGVKSINDLEGDLKRINEELKYVDINSKEFKNLTQEASRTSSELKKVANELKPITGVEQRDAMKKTGDALAGAFQVGGAAALLFGADTQEQFQKVAKSVGGVVVAIDGMKKMMEFASKENIGRLKSIGQSWNMVAKQSKIAGMSMRTALISTGVGALLVGIGLLIANWDKLINITKNKANVKAIEALETQLEKEKTIYGNLEKQAKIQAEINELKGEDEKNGAVEIKTQQQKMEMYSKELTILRMKRDDIDKVVKAQEDELKERLRLIKASESIEKKDSDLVKFIKKQKEEVIKLNETLLEQERINAEIGVLVKEEELAILNIKDLRNKTNDDLDDQIAALERLLVIERAKENSSERVYGIEQRLNKLRVIQIRDAKIVTAEDEKRAKMLEAESQAMRINEKIRKSTVALTIEKVEKEIESNKVMFSALKYQEEKSNNINFTNRKLNEYGKALDVIQNKIEKQRDAYAEIDELNSRRVRNDKKGNAIIDEMIASYESLLITGEQYGDKQIEIYDKLGISQEKASKYQQGVVADKVDELVLLDSEMEVLNNKIQIESRVTELLENKNFIEKRSLDFKRKQIEDTLGGMRTEMNALEDIRDTQTLNDEERLDNLNKIKELNDELIIKAQEFNNINNERKVNEEELIYIKNNAINNMNELIIKIKETENEQAKITGELKEQIRLYAEIQDFVEKNAEAIEVTQDLIHESINLVGALYARQAEMRKRDLDEWKKANIDALKEIGDTEKKLSSRRDELNMLLADAEGQRYHDIMAELAEIDNQEQINSDNKQEMMRKEAEMQYAIDEANWKSSVASKTAAIIDSIIFSTLAVIKALPNIPMSIAVGVLGAASAGIIASQPLPPKPTKTKLAIGGEIDGNSHARGGVDVNAEHGEFMVNKAAYAQYGDIIKSLNDSVLPKFANGGEMGKNVNTPSNNPLMDYNELAKVIVDVFKSNPMFVSVKEIRDVERRVAAVESRTSL